MRIVVGVVAVALLVVGCGSASSSDTPSPAVTTASAAAPTSPASTEERARALAAVPAALTSVTAEQRQAACSSYTSGEDAFLSAFETRFDAQFTPITADELATVRSTLDQVCG